MQHLMGLVRRCVDDYQMIEAGDRIAVGVSGGKDSLALLVLLAELKKFHPADFALEAITMKAMAPAALALKTLINSVSTFCVRFGVYILFM